LSLLLQMLLRYSFQSYHILQVLHDFFCIFFFIFFFLFFSQISVESPILFHPSRSILSSSYGICFCFVFLAQVPTVSQSSLGQFLTFPCRVGGQGPHSLAHQKNRISFLIRSLAPRIFGKLLLTLIVGSLL
jgi:hypothetical protein